MIIINLLIFTIVILGFVCPKSKILTLFNITFLWIFLGWNDGGSDFNTYRIIYYSIYSKKENIRGISDFIYKYLNYSAVQLGLDFNQFLIIINLLFIIIFVLAIKRFTDNINIVLGLFCIFPLTESIIQKRNYFAMVLIIYALSYLLQRSSDTKWRFKYVLLIVLAFGFHSISLFYLVFLFIDKFPSKLSLKNFLRLFLGSIIIFILFKNFSPSYFKLQEYSLSIFSKTSIKTLLYFCSMQLLSLFLIDYFLKKREDDKILTIKKINIIVIIFIPLYFFDVTFFRIFRNLIVLYYISFAILYKRSAIQQTRYVLSYLCLICLMLLWAYPNILNGEENIRPASYQQNLIYRYIESLLN